MLHFRIKHHAGLRKSARKDVKYPAWVDADDGSSPRTCTVSDVSQTGARLAIENPNDIPDEFTLLLTGGGTVRRRCRVVRRSDGEIGVQFVSGSPPRAATLVR